MPHMSEYEVEARFIERLESLGYVFAPLNNYDDVLANFRLELSKLNAAKLIEAKGEASFSDAEFKRVLIHVENKSVYESAKILRDKYVLTLDNGKSVYLEFFSSDTNRNIYQVSHQITMDKDHKDDVSYKNRYDVTILINGLPLVQIELKRPGVEINEAINQINRYRSFSFRGLFRYLKIFVVSNSVQTKYFSNENETMNGAYMETNIKRFQLLDELENNKTLPGIFVPPPLAGQISVSLNCRLTERESSFASKTLYLLWKYSETHPFKTHARCHLFVVKDDHIPLLDLQPEGRIAAFGLAIVHMDRIKEMAPEHNRAELFMIIMLEELCHILYDVQDEHLVKEIVFEIVTMETKWTTPHAFYPDMFDEDGKRIPRKPKEERIKEFYGDLEKHRPEIDQEHADGPAARALRMKHGDPRDMRLKLVGERDCLAAPALFGIRVSVAENCGFTPFETSWILLLFPLLHEYAKSHPVKIDAGCMVFAVRDDQIPLINMKPWISGMAFCASIVHMDKLRERSKETGEDSTKAFVRALLTGICRILYDLHDEAPLNEMVDDLIVRFQKSVKQ